MSLVEEEILTAFEKHPILAPDQLEELTNYSLRTIRKYLKKLVDEGRLRKVPLLWDTRRYIYVTVRERLIK